MARNAQSFIVETLEMPGKPGAIQFSKNPDGERVGFSHCCPCGCGRWSFVRLNPERWAPGSRTPMWTVVSGDDLHMTLTPSIGIYHQGADQGKPGYHWHGYLRNGVFEEC
jgi:hypothetical protein